jgi:hypothetical protein
MQSVRGDRAVSADKPGRKTMAVVKRTVVDKLDDLDGSEAVWSLVIVLDKRRYKLDLSDDHFQELITPLLKVATPGNTPGRLASLRTVDPVTQAERTERARKANEARWAGHTRVTPVRGTKKDGQPRMTRSEAASIAGKAAAAKRAQNRAASEGKAAVGWNGNQNLYGQLPDSEKAALRKYLKRPTGRVSDREVREWTGDADKNGEHVGNGNGQGAG